MTKLRILIITLITASVITGCGFKLRNDYQLAERFNVIHLVSLEPHSKLKNEVKKRLKIHNVDVVEDQAESKYLKLIIYPEQLDRRLLSLFRSGQVAEYELIYSITYQLMDEKGEVSDFQFELLREYQDDPDQVLAKSRELELILSELRREAADHIIRQFSIQQI